MKQKTIEDIKKYLETESEDSKIYIGCDSISYRKNDVRYADYYTVVVIHKNKHNGCKIFGEKETELDKTYNPKKPSFRLMNEVYKTSSLFIELADSIGDRECEIHLDINSHKNHLSNLIIEQAIGYIKGTCNVIPKVKPEAWCASYVADRFLKKAMYMETMA